MSAKNTLFNYFTKKSVDKKENCVNGDGAGDAKSVAKNPDQEDSPKSAKKKCLTPRSENSTTKGSEKKKKKSTKKDSPVENKAPTKKRRRIIMQSDSSDEGDTSMRSEPAKKKKTSKDSGSEEEEDWKPQVESAESESSEEEPVDSSSSEEDSESEESEDEEVKKRPSAPRSQASKKPAAKKINTSIKADSENIPSSAAVIQERSWAHLSFEFLKPEKIRDGEKRRPDHPDYNPRTVFVPSDFMRDLTPAMRQWWEIKSKHFDCVLFLKLGKFYELYHMDAVTGVNELGLIFMKHPDVAHSGFPEAGYARYSKVLVEKGYKVARVEQTETPDMMQERCKQIRAPTKFDRVVKREVCQVTSKGTRTYLAIDGDATSSEHSYLLAINEEVQNQEKNMSRYGICFVDTSVGSFCLGQLDDDRHKSGLRTLLAHYPPAHVLLNKATVSEETKSIVSNAASTALVENLANETEFLNAVATLKMINEKKYFETSEKESSVKWPDILVEATNDKDLSTPADGSELCLSALGACLWYLELCKLDLQVMSGNSFSQYTAGSLPSHQHKLASRMILDSTTLANMDVVFNEETKGMEGTLLGKLDTCSTAFGKRLLRQWLCAPLCSAKAIHRRQQAVSLLMETKTESEEARQMLKELPDLERLLLRVSVYGSSAAAKNHPDSRAIFYEDYSKKKIETLLALLNGFKAALKIIKLWRDRQESSEMLQQLTCTSLQSTNGQFPDLRQQLDFFEAAFDPKEALKTGKLNPRPGFDPEFEEFDQKLAAINKEVNEYLREMKRKFGHGVKFIGADKKRFQLEVPDNAKVPSSFELSSSRKGYKRYYTPEGKELLSRIQVAEEDKKSRELDINRRMFARFSENTAKWTAATQCLAVLDVLLALAKYGRDEVSCMPSVVESSEDQRPFIDIVDGCLPTTTLANFIPNDTMVGGSGARLLLLSGPNMGGKSTLMRQVGLITILAQIGSCVPANRCTLTPTDRIFTRLGAQDHILAGESTFFVEMSETAAILKHATPHSLVLVDELGRGTTTFDGAAIASAVLERLITKECRSIFSTHYHFLVEKYEKCTDVQLVHMACVLEEEEEDEKEEVEAKVENVTFLYKLAPGACPSSHGFNAARLAGLPAELVVRAKQQALKLQSYPHKVQLFQKLMTMQKPDKTELSNLMRLFTAIKKWGRADNKK